MKTQAELAAMATQHQANPLSNLLNQFGADPVTRQLLEQAQVDGLGVLGMRDYSTVTLPELAFEVDTLASRVDLNERRLSVLTDRVNILEEEKGKTWKLSEQQKP